MNIEKRITVRVTVHLDGRGSAAIGVVTQEWNGAHRVDRRLASARPVPQHLPPCPRGIPEEVWVAWHALGERIAAWEDPGRWKER